MNIHPEPHPLAGQTVTLPPKTLNPNQAEPVEYRIEDWWDRVGGGSWALASGNAACLAYAIRGGVAGLPLNDEVVYGKVGGLGHLVHVSEFEGTGQ